MSRKKSLIRLLFGLPDKIKRIRGDLTQAKFAGLIGVNQGTVHKYEKGISAPSDETLKKIADHGGVSVEWLLSGDIKEGAGPGESITIESPTLPSQIHEPYLFGGVAMGAMTQIIEVVEEFLSQRKKPLKPVRKALLLSLCYDKFQKTGQPLDQATLKEFLRQVD